MARRTRRPLGPLDPRAQAILRAVIEEYVSTRQPGRQPRARRQVQPARVFARPCAASSRSSSWRDCSRTRTPRPAACRRTLGYRYYVESIVELGAAAGRRAADDPPPVRPGRVRERALVPPRRDDARQRHEVGRAGHPGEARRGPPSPRRPRRHPRAPREPDPRPARGHGEAAAHQPRPAAFAGDPRAWPSSLVNEHLADLTAAQIARRLPRLEAMGDSDVADVRPRASASASCARCASSTPRRSKRCSATACSTSSQRRSSPRATRSGASSRPSRTAHTSATSSAASPAAGHVHVFIGEENPNSRDARGVPHARAVRAARPRGRSRRCPWANPHVVPAGDRHRELRVGPARRARRPPLRLIHSHRAAVSSRCPRQQSGKPMTDHPHRPTDDSAIPARTAVRPGPDRHVGRPPGRGRDRDRPDEAPVRGRSAEIERLTAEARDRLQRRRRSCSRPSSANARSSRTSAAGRPRSANAKPGSRATTS